MAWRKLNDLRKAYVASGLDLGKPSDTSTAGCRGKVRHATQDAAVRHVRDLRETGRVRKGGVVSEYRCQYCHFWHVGNKRVSQ